MKILKAPFTLAIDLIGLAITLVAVYYRRYANKSKSSLEKPRLVWGPTPLLNYKYFSNALKSKGYEAKTLVFPPYHISDEGDFDIYMEDFFPHLKKIWPLSSIRTRLLPYLTFTFAIRHFDIFHHNCLGGFLGSSTFWQCEAWLLRKARCKCIVSTFGGDVQRYSRIIDPCFRHALQINYPQNARREYEIMQRVNYWAKKADIFFSGSNTDGIGRWDYLVPSTLCIDLDLWRNKNVYSKNDGNNGPVKIIHTPNHRGVKGTEFIIDAVEELKSEGLEVELILIENKKNAEVRRMMQCEADILAEQLVQNAYGLNAIEGMASGIPVLANLGYELYTRIFRRYSFLNECPILSTTPETIKDHLRILITNPDLREELGRAGRLYVEKYHCYETAQLVFEAFYDRIWYGKEVDLMNLFHPLKSAYVKNKPKVKHPLVENRLPPSYFHERQAEKRDSG